MRILHLLSAGLLIATSFFFAYIVNIRLKDMSLSIASLRDQNEKLSYSMTLLENKHNQLEDNLSKYLPYIAGDTSAPNEKMERDIANFTERYRNLGKRNNKSCIDDDGKRVIINNCKVTITGENLHVNNGKGKMKKYLKNGKGNVIIGYNQVDGQSVIRDGSHNLVLGIGNDYTAVGGIVGGYGNTISANFASVITGENNQAIGKSSIVLGGKNQVAERAMSVIEGGKGGRVSVEENDGNGTCPKNEPEPGNSCSSSNLSCKYGEECCCGECSHSFQCDCEDGEWMCFYTDFCFREPCGSKGMMCSSGEYCVDGVCCEGTNQRS